MGVLGRSDLELRADVVEEFGGDYGCRWYEARALLARGFFVGIRVDVDVVLEELRAEDVEVGGVAESVEGFVRIFDSQLEDGWVLEACGVDGRVEVSSVAGALVRGEDEELGYADTGRQLGDLHVVVVWPWFVLDGWFLGGVSLIEPPAIGGRVSNYRVL